MEEYSGRGWSGVEEGKLIDDGIGIGIGIGCWVMDEWVEYLQ